MTSFLNADSYSSPLVLFFGLATFAGCMGLGFLLLRLAQATQTAVTSPLAFARLVRSNLMHRREITALLQPERAPPSNPNQLVLL